METDRTSFLLYAAASSPAEASEGGARASHGAFKLSESQKQLLAEAFGVLGISPPQRDAMADVLEKACEARLQLDAMIKIFRAARQCVPTISNMTHRCQAPVLGAISNTQLDTFLKVVDRKLGEIVSLDPLANDDVARKAKETGNRGAAYLGEIAAPEHGEEKSLKTSVSESSPAGNSSRILLRRADGSATDSIGQKSKLSPEQAAVWKKHAEAALRRETIVGMDSESAMSAAEDLVQRRGDVVEALAKMARKVKGSRSPRAH